MRENPDLSNIIRTPLEEGGTPFKVAVQLTHIQDKWSAKS